MIKEKVTSVFPYFLTEGAVVDAVTVSRDAKPDALNGAGSSNWPLWGTIVPEGLTITPSRKGEIAVNAPSASGGWYRKDKIILQCDWEISFQMQDLDEKTLAMMFGAAAPIAHNTAFSAFQNKSHLRGILKLQFVDQNGTVVHNVDAFGILQIDAVKVPGQDLTKPGFKMEVFGQCPVNAGLIQWN